MCSAILQRMDNALEGLPIKEQPVASSCPTCKRSWKPQRQRYKSRFPHEEELTTKTARLEELNSLLNLDHKEPEIVDTEPDEDQRPPERRRPQLERFKTNRKLEEIMGYQESWLYIEPQQQIQEIDPGIRKGGAVRLL